ncbi:MAG: DsbA family oxidoreductase [Pseudomonadota bacterium]
METPESRQNYATLAPTEINIDIVSDVMCPWCYIGKRRLERALEMVPEVSAAIRWRPFQLDSTLPPEGKDRKQYLAEKFGGLDRAKALYDNVLTAAAGEGLDLKVHKIERSPNTIDAHRLIRWASTEGDQDAVVERLFQLYFMEGADLTDRSLYAEVAEETGMDRALVERLYENGADIDAVTDEIAVANRMGVTGVPCFIFDNQYAVMGAQDSEALAGVLRKIIEEKAQAGNVEETDASPA